MNFNYLVLFLTLLLTMRTFICDEYNRQKLTFHITPHTHDNAGWLATIDQYYKGDMAPFGECIKCILDNIYELLDKNPMRIFSYFEMVFFERWYYEQDEKHKTRIKEFVKNGQLNFPNGGWVMNDEACTYYDDMIEQMLLGHRFLNKEFGYKPTIGWHIDPFGHSSTQASLFSQMGFNMFFIERIDFQDDDKKDRDKNYEFIWRSYGSLPENYISTHINHFKYGSELNDLGHLISDTNSIVKNSSLIPKNLTKIVLGFQNENSYLKTSNTLMLIGNDLSFSTTANTLYESIEELISQINSNPHFNTLAKLSSPEKFAKEWYNEYKLNLNIQLNIKTDDFFPYTDRPDTFYGPGYWTGYFTSKPSIKLNIKEASQLMNNYRKIYAKILLNDLKNASHESLWDQINKSLDKLERALAIAQHHDSLSGIAIDKVTEDYIKMLSEAKMDNLEVFIILNFN